MNKKRRVFSFEEKAHIVWRLEYGESNKEIAKELGVSHSTISTIFKIKTNLENFLNEANLNRKKIRISKHENIEKALLSWFKTQSNKNIPINGPILQVKADEFAKLMILLKDPVRASMTCIKFFLRGCNTFKQLNDNLSHLNNAQKHLEAEMELFQNWENINFNRTENVETSFPMQLDYKSLNAYLNTILLQKEITRFLSKYEELPLYILKQISEHQMNSPQKCLPSLFGSSDEKINLAVFILLLGRNLHDGFGLSYRIVQEFKLTPIKVYSQVAQFLTENNRVEDVFKLCDCIFTNNNTKESAKVVDEVVLDVIKNYNKCSDLNIKQKSLIKIVKNIEIQISCYVNIEQLENAYLLAIQHKRFDQVKIILERAKELKRFDMEKVCKKKLKMIT